jgi:DNA polymerase bacteriophage-type
VNAILSPALGTLSGMPLVYIPTGKPILYVWLDYESQSKCPISAGSSRYAQDPSTRAYIASLAICEPNGDAPVTSRFIWTDRPWQLEMPDSWEHVHGIEWLRDLFGDDRYEIWCIAHNVSFERSICEYTLDIPPPARWIDTMDIANSRGLPAGLDKLGQYCFRTPKDELGKNLMLKLCAPPKHGRNKGVLPDITQDDIQNLITYSCGDTVVARQFSLEYGILIKPDHEQDVRDCHHAINHFGIGFDLDYATALDSMEQFFRHQAMLRVADVTGNEITGDDLFRVKFITEAINANLPADMQITNLRARTLEDLMEDAEDRDDVGPEVIEVVKSRLIVTRAALDKVRAAMSMVCDDGRIRDQFNYWGAGTGRWAGRGTQPQNMKRPDEDFDLQAAILAVKNRDTEAFLRLCVDEKGKTRQPYELLGSLVRGIFIPKPGHVFVVGDYASIEARVLMWLARQEEGLQEHRDADAGLIDDVYCAFASSIYGYEVRKKTHKKERQAGKVGQLAGGYGGGPNAVQRMAFGNRIDLDAAGVTPQQVVDKWRGHYYKVPTLWADIERAFSQAATQHRTVSVAGMQFMAKDRHVHIELPSGRRLTYMNARKRASTREGREGQLVLAYDTMNRGAVRTKEVYGGLLTENCFGRDTLVVTLKGNKPIASVTAEDYLWDGHDWVQSRGAISRGRKGAGEWLGVSVTSDHRVLVDGEWRAVGGLRADTTSGALACGRALCAGVYVPALPRSLNAPWGQYWGLWVSVGDAEVFDILACGPRSRFTVVTDEGPVIVHNCDQAISRDMLARTIRAAILEQGYDVPLHVHDEVVLEVEEARAEEAAAWLGHYMSTPPPWAPNVPLSCKPSIMTRYGKD